MTNLDYIIIGKAIKGVKTLKTIFYLSTAEAVFVYVLVGASIVIYAINITKKVVKK